MNNQVTFKIWRTDENGGGKFVDYTTEITEGLVVLDVVHKIQKEQANDLAVRWNCKAGKCGSCSAEVNGMPKLMCMTRMDTLRHRPSPSPSSRCARFRASAIWRRMFRGTSASKRRSRNSIRASPTAEDGTWRMHAGRRGPRAGIPQVHRMFSLPGRLPRLARPPQAR